MSDPKCERCGVSGYGRCPCPEIRFGPSERDPSPEEIKTMADLLIKGVLARTEPETPAPGIL